MKTKHLKAAGAAVSLFIASGPALASILWSRVSAGTGLAWRDAHAPATELRRGGREHIMTRTMPVARYLLAAALTVAVALGAGGTAFAARPSESDSSPIGETADDAGSVADPVTPVPPADPPGGGVAAGGAVGGDVTASSTGTNAPWNVVDSYHIEADTAVQVEFHFAEELTPSAYVQDAQNGFRNSPAGGTYIGPVLVRAPLPGEYGVFANSTGQPIGGGPSYGDRVSPPPEGFVRTFSELETALNAHLTAVQAAIAQNAPMPRRTIFVAAFAEIDLGAATLTIPPGVTLASSRGRVFDFYNEIYYDSLGHRIYNSPGGLIKSSSDTEGNSLVVLSRHNLGTTRALPPVRITGLRFKGPNPHEDPPDFGDCSAAGRKAIYASEDGHEEDPAKIVDRVLEIDNNEFSSWPRVAIEIAGIRGGYVHHNYIHHSQRNPQEHFPCALYSWHAAGYGVAVNNGLVYIEANRFEMNRHSIASSGDKFTDYIAMYNVLGEDGPSHHFDVHGGEDRGDGTHIAGRNIVIAYNTDNGDEEDAVNIRGNPASGAWVIGNEFRGSRDSIKQTKVPVACQNVFVPGRPGYWDYRCTYFPQGLTVEDNIFNSSCHTDCGGGGPGTGGWGPGSDGNPIQQQ